MSTERSTRKVAWWQVALVPLLFGAFVTAAFFTATLDPGLEESSHILGSALIQLTEKLAKENVMAAQKWYDALIKQSDNISDESVLELERATRDLAELWGHEPSRSRDNKNNQKLKQVFGILQEFEKRVESLYFIARNELQDQLHRDIAITLSELRAVSRTFGITLRDFTASLQGLCQRPTNYQQLLLDFGAAAAAVCFVLVLSVNRKYGRMLRVSLCTLPLVAFAAMQALQWRITAESLRSISPPATVTIIVLTGCIAVAMSVADSRAVVLVASLVTALVAIGAQLFFGSHVHVCSIREALGAPCATEMPCPITAFKLAEYNNITKNLFMSPESEIRLRRLNGSLYVLSEMGAFNTGKSVRLTVSYRLLLPKQLRNKCTCEFLIRDADRNNNLTRKGMTRGLWIMVLPVSQIRVGDIDSGPLKQAVQQLDKNGTLIFLDSEGGDEAGQEVASINLMQLLVVQLSSHVNFAVKEIMCPNTIKHIGMLSHLWKLFTLFEDSHKSCLQLMEQKSQSDTKCSEFAIISMKGTELLPLFPDIKSYVGEVISVPDDFSLDATKTLKGELQKAKNQNDSRDAANQVIKYMPNVTYWGTLPAAFEEIAFFVSMKKTPGLLSTRKPGFLFGWSKFNLPAILNRVKPKVLRSKVVNGRELVRYVQQFLHITSTIELDWLRADSSNALRDTICKHITVKFNEFMDELDSASFLDANLPTESDPVCLNANDKCPDADFERMWSGVYQNITETLCFLRHLMTDAGWTQCWKEEVDAKISKAHDKLLQKNRELCNYQWHLGEWSTGRNGTCPTYLIRSKQCILQGNPRPAECCSDMETPEVDASREVWSYYWARKAWTDCNQPNCGRQKRGVTCMRCDGVPNQDEDNCRSNGTKPLDNRRCNVKYHVEVGDWTPAFCHCGQQQKRELVCQSNCGEEVDMSLCSEGSKQETVRPCPDCRNGGN